MAEGMKQTNQGGLVAQAANNVQPAKPKTLRDYVQQMEGQFAKALPKVITADRFTRIALTALSTTPALLECTRESFLGALMQAAQLGLEPNTPLGQAYLIPFKNTKKNATECQFQIGYKGLLDLCYRSGDVSSISAHVVYENDKFIYVLGLDEKLVHVPAPSERGSAKFVYAVFKLKNGGFRFEVMSMDDVKHHAERYSKAYKFGPWQTNFEEMALKTVLKKVLKYAPIRTDFVTADEKVATISNPSGEDIVLMTSDVDAVETEVDKDTGEVRAKNDTETSV